MLQRSFKLAGLFTLLLLGVLLVFTVAHGQQQLLVDIWTDRGGRGVGKPCGIYNSGEVILLYIEVNRKALIRLSLILSDGVELTDVIIPLWVNAGRYKLEWNINLPAGKNVFVLEVEDEQGNKASDECPIDIMQIPTVLVTIMTTHTITETRTVIEYVTEYITMYSKTKTLVNILYVTRTATVYETLTITQTLFSKVSYSIATIGICHALYKRIKKRKRT